MAASRICSIPNCGKSSFARGWCRSHYGRWREYGDPHAGSTIKGEPERYFREIVLTHDGGDCLIWPYAEDGPGYAKLWQDGAVKTVSRLVCEHFYGPPPTQEHEAAHSCGNGNGGCVSPRHLRWATSSENKADQLEHGTAPRGERCGRSKLNETDVLRIRALCGSVPQREIAELFEIDQSTVSDINRRKRWGWLP